MTPVKAQIFRASIILINFFAAAVCFDNGSPSLGWFNIILGITNCAAFCYAIPRKKKELTGQ